MRLRVTMSSPLYESNLSTIVKKKLLSNLIKPKKIRNKISFFYDLPYLRRNRRRRIIACIDKIIIDEIINPMNTVVTVNTITNIVN